MFQVNRQNDRHYAPKGSNPCFVVEHVAHPGRVTVFAAMHATKGIIVEFIEEPNAKGELMPVTVNTKRYTEMLEQKIFPEIRKRRRNADDKTGQ